MSKKQSSILQKDGTRSVLASLLSIIIGLAAGALVILIVGLCNPSLGLRSAWEGIRLVIFGLFSTGRNVAGTLTFGFNPASVGNMLFRATPVILTGLSVAVAFKTGLFNIGAAGQYLAGTAATLFIALCIPSSVIPAGVIWCLAFIGGMLAGALWGVIPGMLKAFLNINEVLACIMTNWIWTRSSPAARSTAASSSRSFWRCWCTFCSPAPPWATSSRPAAPTASPRAMPA